MKKCRVQIPPSLSKSLRHLHPELKAKLKNALKTLEVDPFLGKPLKEKLTGLYSYRVTHYRIIYEIRQKEVVVAVIEIAERKIVYEEVMKVLKKF
jgi:mRNA interferase RelE/StbE